MVGADLRTTQPREVGLGLVRAGIFVLEGYRVVDALSIEASIQGISPPYRGAVHIRDCRGDLRATAGPPGPPEEQACGRGGIDLFGYIRVLHEADVDVSANLEVIGAKEYELAQVATIAAESRGYLNACLRACGAR